MPGTGHVQVASGPDCSCELLLSLAELICQLTAHLDRLGPSGCEGIALVTVDLAASWQKALRARVGAKAAKALKGTRFCLLKYPARLKPGEKRRLETLRRQNRALDRAYRLKEYLGRSSWSRPRLARQGGHLQGSVARIGGGRFPRPASAGCQPGCTDSAPPRKSASSRCQVWPLAWRTSRYPASWVR